MEVLQLLINQPWRALWLLAGVIGIVHVAFQTKQPYWAMVLLIASAQVAGLAFREF